jgi:tRNA1(Val) A37 N6-methylase TrmN6
MQYDDITTEMLGSELSIYISSEHRFGTDAFLLSDFAGGRHKDYVCDFCTGSGIVALLTYKNFKPAHIDAVEIQEKAHELLKMTVQSNKLDCLTPILCDLKDYRSEKELDLITCNPPYKISGTGAKNDETAVSIARHEVMCTIDDVCKAAARNLKFGGRLCLCQRPERLTDVLECMRAHDLEPKRLRFVQGRADKAPKLFLCEAKRGAKQGYMDVLPALIIEDENGFTAEMKSIYGSYKEGYNG